MHLQYLAKSQSTQRCQSLITPGSDHPPVLEPHMLSLATKLGKSVVDVDQLLVPTAIYRERKYFQSVILWNEFI
jgi:hypothetical protein